MADIRVLIVDDASEARLSMRKMLEVEGGFAVAGEAADGEHAITAARRLKPDVILMDVNLPGQDGLSVTEKLVQETQARIVIVSVEGGQEYMRRAMAAGARDYLVKPFSSNALAQALRGVVQDVDGPAHGRAVTVIAAKGGVGKSVLAVNLAVMFARRNPTLQVAIIDLNLTGGHVAALTGIKAGATILDVCRTRRAVDEHILRQLMPSPPGLPVRVLAAPEAPGEPLETDRLQEVLQFIKDSFDLVVIDTGAAADPTVRLALEVADHSVFVTTPEVPALRSSARWLKQLLATGLVDEARLSIVCNRTNEQQAMPPHTVAEALGRPVAVQVPFDRDMFAAVNRGQPLAGRRQAAALQRPLETLAGGLGGTATSIGQAEKPRPLLGLPLPDLGGFGPRA